jgi:hypothetical protein
MDHCLISETNGLTNRNVTASGQGRLVTARAGVLGARRDRFSDRGAEAPIGEAGSRRRGARDCRDPTGARLCTCVFVRGEIADGQGTPKV